MAGTIKETIQKTDIFLCTILLTLFCVLFGYLYQEMITYRFDPRIISQYLRSQDIPHEVPGRLFLSDSDIHISAGYLYVNGYDPTEFNFQHPPLVKYLYGISTLLTGNPFTVQFILAALLLFLTFAAGKLFLKSSLAGFVAGLFLLVDPLFHHVSSQALLDLGQAVFLTAFLIVALRYPRFIFVQGVLLGLAAVSKFFFPVAVVWMGVLLFRWWQYKEFRIVDNLKIAGIAGIVLYLVYSMTVLKLGVHSPVFYQLKMLKYWIHHSVSSMPGANVLLFITGYYQPWWGKQSTAFSEVWSFMWPLSLLAALLSIVNYWRLKSRKDIFQLFIFAFPLYYLLTLAVQAPFVRYFIVLLPWLYIGIAYVLLHYIQHLLHFKKPVV